MSVGVLPWLPTPPDACPVPQVRIWEIPEGGLKRNMTEAVLELYGHSRRVGLVEWHPTTNNILFSAGYDYKVGTARPLCSAAAVVVVFPPLDTGGSHLRAAGNKMSHHVCGRWYLPSSWGTFPPLGGLAPGHKDDFNCAHADLGGGKGALWVMRG